MKTLVELCAGSAAVSLRWLRAGAVPPIGYLGGKRAFADAILGALGLAPGGCRGERVVLVEPGPWGEAWAAWRTDEGRKGTIDQLRAWGDRDPRDLWRELAAAPVPSDLAARVATWAVLQFWSFGRKPVVARPGDGLSAAWRTHGFDRVGAYRSTVAAERRAAGEDYEIGRDQQLPILIDRLQRLPRLDGVEVKLVDARTVPPHPRRRRADRPRLRGHDRLRVHAPPARRPRGSASLVRRRFFRRRLRERTARPRRLAPSQAPAAVRSWPHVLRAARRMADDELSAGRPARHDAGGDAMMSATSLLHAHVAPPPMGSTSTPTPRAAGSTCCRSTAASRSCTATSHGGCGKAGGCPGPRLATVGSLGCGATGLRSTAGFADGSPGLGCLRNFLDSLAFVDLPKKYLCFLARELKCLS